MDRLASQYQPCPTQDLYCERNAKTAQSLGKLENVRRHAAEAIGRRDHHCVSGVEGEQARSNSGLLARLPLTP